MDVRNSELPSQRIQDTVPIGTSQYMGLLASSPKDRQFEPLMLKIDQRIASSVSSDDRPQEPVTIHSFFDHMYSFLHGDEGHHLSRKEYRWLHEKVRETWHLVQAQDHYDAIQALYTAYYRQTEPSRTAFNQLVAIKEAEEHRKIDEIQARFRKQIEQERLKNPEGIISTEMYETLHEPLEMGFQSSMDEIERYKLEILSQFPDLDPVYEEQLLREYREVSEVVQSIYEASPGWKQQVGLGNRMYRRDKMRERNPHFASDEGWEFTGGYYNSRIGKFSNGEGIESIENIHTFLVHRVRQLLSEHPKRPVVLLDFGGMFGGSFHDLAALLEDEIDRGDVVLCISNLASTQDDITRMIELQQITLERKSKLLDNIRTGKVQYIMADAEELGDVFISVHGERRQIRDTGLDIVIESTAYVEHSLRVDIDTDYLAQHFSANGLFITFSQGTQGGFPLSSRSLMSLPTLQRTASIHRYKMIPEDTERESHLFVLTNTRLLDARDAVRLLEHKHNMHRIEACRDPKGREVVTPTMWVRDGALPVVIHNNDGSELTRLDTHENHVSQSTNDRLMLQGKPAPHIARQLLSSFAALFSGKSH